MVISAKLGKCHQTFFMWAWTDRYWHECVLSRTYCEQSLFSRYNF